MEKRKDIDKLTFSNGANFDKKIYFGKWENDELSGVENLTWTYGSTYKGQFERLIRLFGSAFLFGSN